MEIRVIDNHKTQMMNVIIQSINSSTQLRMAVAFVKMSGYLLIKEALNSFIQKNGKAILLLGLDFHTTSPEILREITEISRNNEFVELYCLSGNIDRTATYHPKLYLFDHPDKTITAIVGSSNLTRGGLKDNVEINIAINAINTEPIMDDLINTFQQLELSERRIQPNDTYINHYEELYKVLKKGRAISKHPSYKELKELEKILPAPEIPVIDLAGWMKLVYEHLPDTEFATKDLYRYEKEFRERYPENQFVKAKIRQQLQFLRNIGHVKKTTEDRWIKIY